MNRETYNSTNERYKHIKYDNQVEIENVYRQNSSYIDKVLGDDEISVVSRIDSDIDDIEINIKNPIEPKSQIPLTSADRRSIINGM